MFRCVKCGKNYVMPLDMHRCMDRHDEEDRKVREEFKKNRKCDWCGVEADLEAYAIITKWGYPVKPQYEVWWISKCCAASINQDEDNQRQAWLLVGEEVEL